jgi:cysteine desulfurase
VTLTERIYLDHAATTPLHPAVLDAMLPHLTEHYGNPSSIHARGRRARQALDEARESIARRLGATPREIVFTSGGSEADNLAIKGIAWAMSARGRHLITSSVEHHAVLHACQVLERSGFEVTYLPVDRYGRVNPADVADAITDRTTLVSVMYANNEVGTVQPIAEIAALCRGAGVRFHTDAVQAAGHLPLDVDELGVDLLTLSAHKIYGPKGVGALYLRRGIALLPQVQGGSQERQRRAGTGNVAGAAGLAAALELVARAESAVGQLRDALVDGMTAIEGVTLTGHPSERLPGSASFLVERVDGGDLVAALDLEGIEVSTGSACTSGSTEPSHVLLAMGIEPHDAAGSLRMTLGAGTTQAQIERTVEVARAVIRRLRDATAPRAEVASA